MIYVIWSSFYHTDWCSSALSFWLNCHDSLQMAAPVSWCSDAWEEVVTCWSSSVNANATVEGTNDAFLQCRLLCYHLLFSASLAKTSQHNSTSITKHFLVDKSFWGASINCGLACFKHWSMQSKLELSAVTHKVMLAAFAGTCSLSVSVDLHQWDFLRVWQIIQRVGSAPAEGWLRSEAHSWFFDSSKWCRGNGDTLLFLSLTFYLSVFFGGLVVFYLMLLSTVGNLQ